MRGKEMEKMSNKVTKMVFGGLLIALGILLPQAFHAFGTAGGATFLPIHIPVLMAGLILGPYYGGVIGVIVPILSTVLTGMPPVPKVYFMVLELAVYGMVSGWMIRKTNVYVSLLVSMFLGRMAYGFSLIVLVKICHITFPFANQAAFFGGIVTGIPGMVIQIVLLPILYHVLKRGGFLFES